MNTHTFISALLAPAAVLTSYAELSEVDTKILTLQKELLGAARLIFSINEENADVVAVKLEQITLRLESLTAQISAEDYENMSDEGEALFFRNLESAKECLSDAQSGVNEEEFRRILRRNRRLSSAMVRFNRVNKQFSNRVNQNRRETLEYLFASELEKCTTEEKLILEGQKICLEMAKLIAGVNEGNAEEVAAQIKLYADRYEQIGAQLQPDDINKMGQLPWMVYLKSMRDLVLYSARMEQNMPVYTQVMAKTPALFEASLRWSGISNAVNDKIYGKMNAERRAQRDRELREIVRSLN